MIAEKLVELVEIHASRLSADVAQDLVTNVRTRGFHKVPKADLEARVFRLFHHLGDWLSDRRSERVKAEFAEWGSRRFDQEIPLSEIIYAIVILKQHLRQYIRDNGLIEAAFPRSVDRCGAAHGEKVDHDAGPQSVRGDRSATSGLRRSRNARSWRIGNTATP